MAKICSAAKSANIAVVLGFSENEHNSLYIAQCIISASGEIVMKRRKLKPSHMERTVFGDADGPSLNNVVDLDGVGKVGALSCWEHMQPLLKYHTISLREEIHVSAWPPLITFVEESQGLFSMSAEGRLAFMTVGGGEEHALLTYLRLRSTFANTRNGILDLCAPLYCHYYLGWH
jgi:nitrilase